MSRYRAIVDRIKAILRAEHGVAAVEFALILPVMLLTYVGTLEASTLITVDRKVQSVAGAIGDLVARADGAVSASQLQDYFQAASGIMTPYSASEVRQVVTAVQVDEDGETEVLWSRRFEGGAYHTSSEHTPGDSFELPAAMINISLGRTVIAAEASYTYTPLLGTVINAPVNLYRANFFLPRFGKPITAN